MFSDPGPWCCNSIKDNKAIKVTSMKGGTVCEISIDHRHAYIQGDEVIITTKENRTAIYSVRGNYKRLI